MTANDVFARAYSSLTALQNNLSKMTIPMVEEIYVNQYHSILDRLETPDFKLTEFRVDKSEIKPQRIDIPVITFGQTSNTSGRYSNNKYVARALLLIKLESVLGYFTFLTEEPKPTIGFKH